MGDIEQYLDELSGVRHERGKVLHQRVQRLFPEVKLSMHYKMPTYQLGEQFLAWGNKKSYLSVYTCATPRIAEFKQKHPGVPSGVGCINFRDNDIFPIEDLEYVIRNALAPSAALLAQERKLAQAAKVKRNTKKKIT